MARAEEAREAYVQGPAFSQRSCTWPSCRRWKSTSQACRKAPFRVGCKLIARGTRGRAGEGRT
eukprot:11220543-Lingulodinium_polyedra.AAC.1